MKIKSLIVGAAALGLVSAAHAQTVINIAGATAFRSAAHASILSAFAASGGSLTGYAYTGATASSASQQIYKGTLPGITGTTTIRTCWYGSVEGLQLLSSATSVTNTALKQFIKSSVSVSPSGTGSVASGDLETGTVIHMAFSDVAKESTPFSASTFSGGPVGVVAFVPVINKDANADITNITTQVFKRLAVNGVVPASMFTGKSATTGNITLTGRYDGSGTRVAFLSEIGHGASTNVNQSYMTLDGSTISALTQVPVVTANNTASLATLGIEKSAAFGTTKNVAGNGGYTSGGTLSTFFKYASASGVNNFVSWIGTKDYVDKAYNAGSGGRVLAYNGVKLDNVAGGTSNINNTTDKDKIAYGQYTAWSFENLYYKVGTGATAPQLATVFTALKTGMNASNLGASGVPLSSMQVKRTGSDGSVVLPGTIN